MSAPTIFVKDLRMRPTFYSGYALRLVMYLAFEGDRLSSVAEIAGAL